MNFIKLIITYRKNSYDFQQRQNSRSSLQDKYLWHAPIKMSNYEINLQPNNKKISQQQLKRKEIDLKYYSKVHTALIDLNKSRVELIFNNFENTKRINKVNQEGEIVLY
ncbi:hypothetical protein TTHERM_00259590 (macronuclear) [Tetrahymena thermophila SB210]|uniref:Uncharacterized protein n=1 Tax=Tetrahymena thermophila (strain SB210) TaxID=312017 RepID=Q22UC7_TETTS|nr:hypothetical protein TTHERM_00259590 [Tetrahymena thermophila SB210]EAR88760.2 hypothetical protein TTHERM_00259590 [Tetrahymena thermophila SB210]|eukprot:XP_001009005.2 hypothetical protein TTHERM_00259590 [Tetrahymena thermophila SB210]